MEYGSREIGQPGYKSRNKQAGLKQAKMKQTFAQANVASGECANRQSVGTADQK
jgi:hypothetical protein